MRAVIQRTFRSVLSVDGEVKGEIKSGLTVFLAVCRGDTEEQADYFARKLVRLRVFRDENDKMNRSILDAGGEISSSRSFRWRGSSAKGRATAPISAMRRSPRAPANSMNGWSARCERRA